MIFIKLLLYILLLDFTGYCFNQSLLKSKDNYNVLYGFVFWVALIQLTSIPFIIKSIPIVPYLIFLFIIIAILFMFNIKRIEIGNYTILDRVKSITKTQALFYIILSSILIMFSVSGIDQWLYGALVNSAADGLNSQAGFLPNSITNSTVHKYNSYTVFNASMIFIFDFSYIEYTYGIIRLAESIIFLQALSMLSKHFNNSKAFVYLFLGFLGINFLSLNMTSPDSFILLLNGNNPTFIWMFVGTILFYEYIFTKNKLYLYLYLIISFSTTTSILPIFPILVAILMFLKFDDFKGPVILYLFLSTPYVLGLSIKHILLYYLLFIIFTYLIFDLIPKYLPFVLGVFIMIIFVSDFSLIFDNGLIKAFTANELFVLIAFLIIYNVKDEDLAFVKNFSFMVLFIYTLTFVRDDLSDYYTQFYVIRGRLFFYVPIFYFIIEYLGKWDKYFKYICIILSLLLINMYLVQSLRYDMRSLGEIYLNRSSFDNYNQFIVNSDDISYILSLSEPYDKVDVFYHEPFGGLNPNNNQVSNMYTSSFRPGMSTYFEGDGYSEFYCSNADLCIDVYPKDSDVVYDKVSDKYKYKIARADEQ